jgi:cytochrome c oxidase cbb3-type subunit III
MDKIIKQVLLIIFFILQGSSSIFAQTAPDFSKSYYDTVALFILVVIVLVFAGFMFFGMGEGKVSEKKKTYPVFSKIKQLLTASTPIEREQEILLEDDYDGIKELDNRVPPWFSYLFYLTIIFSVYYMLDYHVFSTSPLQEEEYAEEVRQADMLRADLIKKGAFINEETVTLLTDQESINAGRTVYITNCVACHSEDGGGLIGPNLTDNYWIHGGSVQDIFKIVKYGVPAKGMISWQTQLNPRQIQEVTSFIFTLQGTQPANPKQPEGEKFVPADTTNTVAVL